MNIDRNLKIAIIVSLALHGAIVLELSRAGMFRITKAKHKFQLNYVKSIKRPMRQLARDIPAAKDISIREDAKITTKQMLPAPQFLAGEGSPSATKLTDMNVPGPDLDKPIIGKPEFSPVKKKITIPSMGLSHINTPSYINYYQIVREKIKRAAYQNYNGTQTGEVDVSFVVSSNGQVRQVRLIESRSTNIRTLKEITLKSVYNASPFPEFPKELDYPQLSFNVIISFEVE